MHVFDWIHWGDMQLMRDVLRWLSDVQLRLWQEHHSDFAAPCRQGALCVGVAGFLKCFVVAELQSAEQRRRRVSEGRRSSCSFSPAFWHLKKRLQFIRLLCDNAQRYECAC